MDIEKEHKSKRSKEKKSKKKKHLKKSRSGSDSEEFEEQWVESSSASTSIPKPTLSKTVSKTSPKVSKEEKDSWMDLDAVLRTVTRKDMREKNKKENEKDNKSLSTIEQAGQHSRELNPYWKDGGKGLPGQETAKPKQFPSVGDGGLNWLRKAYKRVHEQAEEEGKSVEEIAAQRWGSLENLQSLIAEAEGKSGRQSSFRQKGEYERHYTRRHQTEDRRGHRDQTDDRGYQSKDRRDRTDDHRERKDYEGSSNDFRREGTCDRESRRDVSGDRRWRDEKNQFHKPGDDYGRNEQSSRSSQKRQPRWMKQSSEDAPKKKINEAESKTKIPERAGPIEKEKSPQAEEEKPKIQAIKSLSEKEMNVLGAKILKAELMGHTELAAKLKVQMDNALKAKKMGIEPEIDEISKANQRIVVLTQSNARGMSRPLHEPDTLTDGRRKKIKVATHDGDGKRVRYFHDDEKYSLKDMFEREKFTTADDDTAMYLKMAAKNRPKTDEDYDIDDVFVDKVARGGSSSQEHERSRQQAIREHKSMSYATENCYQCLDSKVNQKHLIIAMGHKVYLSLPYHESLTDGHCFIVPTNHVESATLADEDVWSEIQQFRKTLTLMFQDRGQDTVFMETSMNLRRHPHMYVECIPLDQESGMMAPMYFKKAILESETEWAENVKLVDLSKKDIRHSVPKGLPYFSVDFGLQGGFAHVVEDERDFPAYFGKEIVGGLLDVEPRLWLKPPKEKFDEQRKKVLQFTEWWTPYDWTSEVRIGDKDSD